MAVEPELGPVAREMADVINARRLVTDVELQISVEGKAKNISGSQALQWVIAMNAALTEVCMRLAGKVDDLTARIDAAERNQQPTVEGREETDH